MVGMSHVGAEFDIELGTGESSHGETRVLTPRRVDEREYSRE